MGLHYALATYLGRLDDWYLPVYIGWGIAMVCFYWYYFKGIRVGFKHKTAGMSWQSNMWNMANDFVYVVPGFTRWWNHDSPTHHWFTIFLWFGLVVWFAMEFIVHYQAIKYDLDDMFPNAKSRNNRLLMYWGIQLCFVAAYAFLWSVMEDPLCHIMFLTTFTGCVIWNFQTSTKRGSKKGFAGSVLIALIVAQAVGYFLIMPSFDPIMSNIYVYFAGICATGLAIAHYVYWKRLPDYVPTELPTEETEKEA